MKPALLLFSALMIISVQRADSQNTILVVHPKSTIDSLVSAPKSAEEGYDPYDLYSEVPKPSAVVVNGLGLNTDVQLAGNASLTRFQRNHLLNGYIDFGRDFLDGGYEWYNDTDYEGASYRIRSRKDSVSKSKLMKNLFSNKVVQEAIYQWLFPSFRNAFATMSVPEQKDYLKMLSDGIAFADTFNITTQTKVVEESENYTYVVGSMNAFLYRRIVNKQLTREDCKQWLTRILNDLSPAQKKIPTPEDDYVLTNYLGYGYFAAVPYTEASGYNAQYSIMHYENKRCKLVPVPKFSMANYDQPESNFFSCYSEEVPGNSRCLFYCDSLGWNFTPTPFSDEMKSWQLLGSGKSARLLIVFAYDFDYDEANRPKSESVYYESDYEGYDYPDTSTSTGIAAIIDLDSGYILVDSIRVTETTIYGQYFEISNEFLDFRNGRVIYYSYITNGYGVMDNRGKVLLPANYKSVELTPDPDVVKVNGKKKVSVFGGGKVKKK